MAIEDSKKVPELRINRMAGRGVATLELPASRAYVHNSGELYALSLRDDKPYLFVTTGTSDTSIITSVPGESVTLNQNPRILHGEFSLTGGRHFATRTCPGRKPEIIDETTAREHTMRALAEALRRDPNLLTVFKELNIQPPAILKTTWDEIVKIETPMEQVCGARQAGE